MGHKISKEQIDPGVKDYIMSFVGDINELETDDKSNIINAVNSLIADRVDNAENMGKLANAIGEPVTANHSVDEVVEGLGEMLSTFKTNMMNSGVMVESSDKFKQLIDKIKGLTEGEGNKGIQFAQGAKVIDIEDISTDDIITNTVETNLNFTPSIIFIDCQVGAYLPTNNTERSWDFYLSNLSEYSFLPHVGDLCINITNITNEKFDIILAPSIATGTIFSFSSYEWYVIGVGEEDTTLRDSLASILQEEGVSVTEEDDIASLITKVDEEFDRQVVPAGTAVASNVDKGKTFINSTGQLVTGTSNKVSPAGNAVAGDVLSGKTFINSTGKTVTGTMANRGGAQTVTPGTSNKTLNSGYYSGNITVKGDSNLKAENIVSGKSIFGVSGTYSGGGLNIISASSLPSTGVENQICVITNTTPSTFNITSCESNMSSTGNNVYMLLSNTTRDPNITVTNNNVNVIYDISAIYQTGSKKDAYVYKSGQWVLLTAGQLNIISNGSYADEYNFYNTNTAFSASSTDYWAMTPEGLECYSNNNNYVIVTTKNKIDFTNFSSLSVTASVNSTDSQSYLKIYGANSATKKTEYASSSSAKPSNAATNVFSLTPSMLGGSTKKFDISNINGSYYLSFAVYCAGTAYQTLITNVTFE